MDDYMLLKYYKEKEHKHEEHKEITNFTEEQARHIVSKMHHTECGNTYIGEVYCMDKAKEIHHKYKEILPESTSCIDMYIALNAQFHDYAELFKLWFKDTIDNKVIESAIVFWFKDEDYTKKSKIVNYFKWDL